jgi:hypothetical protein
MPLTFLEHYEKSGPPLYSAPTNKALNVGASEAGTCPLFAFQVTGFVVMSRHRYKNKACLDVIRKQILPENFKDVTAVRIASYVLGERKSNIFIYGISRIRS